MKITLDNVSFNEAIAWATKVYDSKDDGAYVSFVVDVNKSSGILYHVNSKSCMKRGFQILSIEEEGDESELKLALEGVYLQRLSKSLGSDKNASVMTVENNVVTLHTANGNFTLPTVDTVVSKMPAVKNIGETNDREFFSTLQNISKICDANNPSMPALGCVDLRLNEADSKLTMMATDRYALSEIELDFEAEDYAKDFIEKYKDVMLTADSAKLIAPSKNIDDVITFIYDEKGQKFGYEFSDSRIALFSLPEIPSVPYEKLKKAATSNLTNSVTVDVKAFKAAIGILTNINWSEDDINLTITKDEIKLTDNSKSNSLSVPVEDSTLLEDETSIKFMRVVLNEGFSPITTNKMNIKWKATNLPFIFEGVMDDGEVIDNVLVFIVTIASK